jgi:hypothetical protein
MHAQKDPDGGALPTKSNHDRTIEEGSLLFALQLFQVGLEIKESLG